AERGPRREPGGPTGDGSETVPATIGDVRSPAKVAVVVLLAFLGCCVLPTLSWFTSLLLDDCCTQIEPADTDRWEPTTVIAGVLAVAAGLAALLGWLAGMRRRRARARAGGADAPDLGER